MAKVTTKQERFCQGIVKGLSQIDAYRKAYPAIRMQAKTMHECASRLMTNHKVIARLAELRAPMIEECEITQRDWLRKMMGYFHADVRKMFDTHGNPIEIPQLGDPEALMIEGFEFEENYVTVNKGKPSEQAIPTGYTKKVKLTSKLKAMMEFGKVMGWYEEPDKKNNQGPQRIFIRQWVKEEEHVHIHRGNGGASNGHRDDAGGGVGPAHGVVGLCDEVDAAANGSADDRARMAHDPSAGSSPVGSGAGEARTDGSGNELPEPATAEQRDVHVVERDEAAAVPDSANWRQLLHQRKMDDV